MDRCERYTDLISARLDGELTGEEERELEAHLACCPACRSFWTGCGGRTSTSSF